MSADNWAECPQCWARARALKASERKRAESGYGTMEKEAWLALVKSSEQEIELEDCLREDYEIGIDSQGTFFVIYHGHCKTCNFGFDYKHEKKVDLLAEGDSNG